MTMAAVQKAVYDRLNTHPGLAGVGVYDYVPQDPRSEAESFKFPYLVIGEDLVVNWDTDAETGFEYTLTIHVWSRHKGALETKQIMDEARIALNRTQLDVLGLNVLFIDCESMSVAQRDDTTYHGMMEFRLLAEEL